MSRVGLGVGCCAAAIAAGLTVTQPTEARGKPSARSFDTGEELLVNVKDVSKIRVSMNDVSLQGNDVQQAGSCSETSSHTDAQFTGGTYVAQAGFEDDEIAVATYTLDASEFPIKLTLAEMIFVTSGAAVQTVTQWSFLVWDGPPNTGTLVAEFVADDLILPYIRLGPGTQGVNVQVTVDPGDPEQIFIFNDSGTNQFSIGYRIDLHHSPGIPCTSPPPSNMNAFPATDNTGLDSPLGNYICQTTGQFCFCPGVGQCAPFSSLSFCTPSGDWVMRATWESANCQPNVGACCALDGSCTQEIEATCIQQGSLFAGEGEPCGVGVCPQPNGACCFTVTQCLNLDESSCDTAGGTWLGPDTACAVNDCFPEGACCLPDGSCTDAQSPESCTAAGGTFQGNLTTCAGVSCPAPSGACCLSNGNCLFLTEADCNVIPNSAWAGFGTNCADGNMNGTADDCEAPSTCPADLTGPAGPGNPDGNVDSLDFLLLIGQWGTPCVGSCEADITGPTPLTPDGNVDSLDFLLMIGQWGNPGNCS